MAMVGNGVWHVYIETGFVSQRAEDWVLLVLNVATELVFVLGKEFGVTGRWEMEDLSNHAGDTGVSTLDGQGSGLKEVSGCSRKIRLGVIMSYKVGSRAGTAKDNPFRVHS